MQRDRYDDQKKLEAMQNPTVRIGLARIVAIECLIVVHQRECGEKVILNEVREYAEQYEGA